MLALQRSRTPAQVAAARADRKTEISSFYGALGISTADHVKLPALEKVAENVEDSIRRYVRAAKERFRRLRPYEVEPRIQPCIDDVRGDLSYPSGHAAYAYAMAYLLADMAPERANQLQARAREFAGQRMRLRGALRQRPGSRRNRGAGADARNAQRSRVPARCAGRGRRIARRPAARSALRPLQREPRAAEAGLDAAITRPRCSAAMRATIASPRPNPPVSRLRLVSSRVNARNIDGAIGLPEFLRHRLRPRGGTDPLSRMTLDAARSASRSAARSPAGCSARAP